MNTKETLKAVANHKYDSNKRPSENYNDLKALANEGIELSKWDKDALNDINKIFDFFQEKMDANEPVDIIDCKSIKIGNYVLSVSSKFLSDFHDVDRYPVQLIIHVRYVKDGLKSGIQTWGACCNEHNSLIVKRFNALKNEAYKAEDATKERMAEEAQEFFDYTGIEKY